MARKKISELTEKTSIVDNDLLVIVDSETNPTETKKIKRSNISVTAAAHKTSHQDGGADEISIAALSGTPAALTTHEAAADPHTGYRLESADHTHQTTGAQAGQIDHGAAMVAASLLDDDHTQYQKESEKGAASGYASLDGSTKVVENPANATATPTASKIPIADGSGLLDGWITAAAGEGHITILPHNYQSIGAGTWAITIHTAYFMAFWFGNTSAANLDNVSYQVYLAAGTYTIRIIGTTEADAGIMDVDIDDVEIASFDWYSAGTAQAVVKTDTGNVIATAGLKSLKLRVDGKNAGSSGYLTLIECIALWRTA